MHRPDTKKHVFVSEKRVFCLKWLSKIRGGHPYTSNGEIIHYILDLISPMRLQPFLLFERFYRWIARLLRYRLSDSIPAAFSMFLVDS